MADNGPTQSIAGDPRTSLSSVNVTNERGGTSFLLGDLASSSMVGVYNNERGGTVAISGFRDAVPPPPSGGSTSVQKYKMRAKDPDCSGTVWRAWVVTGVPDYTGAQYPVSYPRCGSTLFNAEIALTWTVST